MANIPAVVSIPLPPLNPKYNGKRWPNKQKNPDKYDATIIGEFIPSSVFIISPPRFM